MWEEDRSFIISFMRSQGRVLEELRSGMLREARLGLARLRFRQSVVVRATKGAVVIELGSYYNSII